MSIIYSYPIKGTPADDDLILISDSASSPQFATKQIKVSSLPGGSASGVSSFNTLTGAVTITGGTNVTLNTVGNNIEINAAGGGGTPSAPLNSVQFNNNSAFGGSANLTFATDTLRVTNTLDVRGDGTNAGKLKLYCESTTQPHAVTIEGPAHAGAAAYTLKLPSPAPANNQILQYTTSGNLGWINTPASTAPQGDDGQFQYKNGSSFAGTDTLRFDADKIHMGRSTSPITRGQLVMYGDGTNASDIQLYNGGNTRFLKIAQQAGATQDLTLTFPGVAPGGSNKILESDASGNLSWINTPTSTSYQVMGSGNSYLAGLVPAGAADHQSNFLRKDGTWQQVSSGISFSGSTASGIATYSSATTANVSSNLTIDNTNKKLNIGSKYSVQDHSSVFKIGSLSSTQEQESIEFYINGFRKVIINEDGRLVASVGSSANPNLKLGTGNDGIYGATNTVQLITNGSSKISISDGNTADIQMNDLVEFGSGLRFGATGETLSSYEEGTWTPAPWVYSGTAPTVESANGTYTIIGDICHITFQIVVTGSSSSSAAMILNGLPTVAQGDATVGEQSAGQLFVNTDSNTYNAIPSMFYVSGDKLTMVVQGGSKNSLTSPYGLKAQDVIANWYRPSSGSGITLKGSATYKLL